MQQWAEIRADLCNRVASIALMSLCTHQGKTWEWNTHGMWKENRINNPVQDNKAHRSFVWNDSPGDKISVVGRLLSSAVLLPIRSISVTVNQAIWLITDSARRRATGNYRNQNRLETATHWNDRDRGNKSLHNDDSWWAASGLACVNQQYEPQCCIFDISQCQLITFSF